MELIYLDHAATTPVLPEVAAEALRGLESLWGNPSSLHATGIAARNALSDARARFAATIGARPEEILFTSGGTEADNLAVIGAARAAVPRGRRVLVSAVEHHAVLHAADVLAAEGFSVGRIPVDVSGRVRPGDLEGLLRPDVVLVSVMHANNETGAVQPLTEISRLLRPRGILLHTDAVQSLGKIPVDVGRLGVDLASFAAHKIYGPKGTGALYVRTGVPLAPLLVGGGHEAGRRAGTENVSGILAFAKAAEIAVRDLTVESDRLRRLRDRLQAELAAGIGDLRMNGPAEDRLPGHLSVCFSGVEAEGVILQLSAEGISVSSGSACASGSGEPSHVLAAMGVPPDVARGTVRFTLGRGTRAEDIPLVVAAVHRAVDRLRALNPLWPTDR